MKINFYIIKIEYQSEKEKSEKKFELEIRN